MLGVKVIVYKNILYSSNPIPIINNIKNKGDSLYTVTFTTNIYIKGSVRGTEYPPTDKGLSPLGGMLCT